MKYIANLRLYGFDEYNIIHIPPEAIDGGSHAYLYTGYNYCGVWLPSDNPPVKRESYKLHFDPAIIEHREVLQTAKNVYIHPRCKLSRTMAATKYSKSLNPWLSDAVVIPCPSAGLCYLYDKVLLFSNDEKKMVFAIVTQCYDTAFEIAKSFHEGMLLSEALTTDLTDFFESKYRYLAVKPTADDYNKAELIYSGPVVYIPDNASYLLELFTGNLPLNKIVFEETLQNSLGSENNKPTAETLMSICEMLNSQDSDTISVGLKALSALDYMHYPNSVKYILRQATGYWKYNKAMDSVSVKFMINKLNNSWSNRKNRLYFDYDKEIYPEDYNLFKELNQQMEKETDDDYNYYLRYLPFIKIEGTNLVPNFKEAS